MIRSTVQFGNGDELSDVIDEHAALRGIEAWEIATSLRKEYHLPPSEVIFDYVEALRARLDAALAGNAALEESQAAMMKGMIFPGETT
jgi:hypothetical protein